MKNRRAAVSFYLNNCPASGCIYSEVSSDAMRRCDHLDDVGQVLTFRELDHGLLVEVSDFDALGNVAALLEELRHASAGCAQLLAEPAMGDLEAPHGRPTLFGVVG